MSDTWQEVGETSIKKVGARTPVLQIDNVSKSYGSAETSVPILESLNLEVYQREVVCIVGPSGVGKTTLLKSIAGLHPLTSGDVRIDGHSIAGPPEEMALVFQDYNRSLMPWLSVAKNIRLPLHHKKLSKKEVDERVSSALNAVALSDASHKYPWQLSGGMQQRVAIARALAYQPEILVMDEPFASVDAQTRFELEDLILKIRDDFGMTILVVTHDIDEAVYLSDRIVVLGGKPAKVIDTIDIVFPGPRTQIETRTLAEFGEERTKILRLIKQASS